MSGIFNEKLLKCKYSEAIDLSNAIFINRRKSLEQWASIINSGEIDVFTEVQLKEPFVNSILSTVLRYKTLMENIEEWNVITEQKTKADATKEDVVLGYFSSKNRDVRIAIELKGPTADLDARQLRKNDHRTPVEQAFSYPPKYGRNCTWLLVSNYKEIRLYNSSDATQFERFIVKDLVIDDDEFKKFIYLLSSKSLISKSERSTVDRFWEENIKEHNKIESAFYDLYKDSRVHLFEDISNNNLGVDINTALEKTQKILDRCLFVAFAENKGLLPEESFIKVCESGARINFFKYGIWEQMKGFFQSIDEGNEGAGITRFNGGLFSYDSVLDSLKIPNKCFDSLREIFSYSFNSEINENILGHIFEKSISDIEELRLNMANINVVKKKGQRNKEGIFYTPKYITKYIVARTLGDYLLNIRVDLGEYNLPTLTNEDMVIDRRSKKVVYTPNFKKHIEFWTKFKGKIENIRILDPSCGSGAFLNEAFDCLHKVTKEVHDWLTKLTGQISMFDLDKHILTNNLFGVDINEESVEITKLSLWLKTAKKDKLLTSLDNNIKCGNSLIDNPECDMNAFDWYKEFPEIMNHGGFDIIVGNPPYVGTKMIPEKHREYYWAKYKELLVNEMDLYELFLYDFSKSKLKKDGFMGYITPNTYFTNSSFENLRKHLINRLTIKNIVDFPYRFFPFEDVNKETSIIILQNKVNTDYTVRFSSISKENMKRYNIFTEQTENFASEISKQTIIKQLDNKFSIKFNSIILNLLTKEDVLGKYLELHKGWMSVPNQTTFGEKTYDEKILRTEHIKENPGIEGILTKCLEGKDIHRYFIDTVDKFVDATKMDRRTFKWHNSPKIIMQRIVGQNRTKIFATVNYDNHVIFPSGNLANLTDSEDNILFYLGILNSDLINYFYNIFYGESNTNLTKEAFEALPIPIIKNIDKTIISNSVSEILKMHEELKDKKARFYHFIFIKYAITSASKKLKYFYLLSFEEFIAEIKKQEDIKLVDYEDLEQFFILYKTDMISLLNSIAKHEKIINDFTYSLYKISSEEIKTIEKRFKETTIIT